MTATPDQVRQASDPATPGATLAELAAAHPELHTAIALNPKTYPALIEWLTQYGGPEVQAALASRAAASAPLPPPPPPPSVISAPVASTPVATVAVASTPATQSATGWREPNRSAALTWGTYDQRYTITLAILGAAGLSTLAAALNGSINVGYLLLANLPLLLVAAAIVVLPAPQVAQRRALIVLGVGVLLTSTPILGAMAGNYSTYFLLSLGHAVVGASVVAAWFAARQRPARSYAILPILLLDPVAAFIGLYGLPYLLWVVVLVVAAAWIGRAIAPGAARPGAGTSVSRPYLAPAITGAVAALGLLGGVIAGNLPGSYCPSAFQWQGLDFLSRDYLTFEYGCDSYAAAMGATMTVLFVIGAAALVVAIVLVGVRLSSRSATSGTPAGWYPVPEQPGRQRWWDGQRWTDHYTDLPS